MAKQQQVSQWQPGQCFLPFSPGAPKSFSPGTIRFVPKSQWAPDSKAKVCFLCPQVKFGMKNRRHHCRLCGQVCCGECTQRRHPKYPETRICTPCYSMIMVGENSLQSAGWYHGSLKRPLCDLRLMSPTTRYGDFLVRESGSVDGYIALSVRSDKKVLHYLIHEKFGKFFIGNEPAANQMYASIQNLITENKAKYSLHRAMIIESFKGTACPQCGATVNSDMEFCEECGTRLRSTAAQIKLYEDQGNEEVTYEDGGQSGNQIYDDEEEKLANKPVYDDDGDTSFLASPQQQPPMMNSASIMMGGQQQQHQQQHQQQQHQQQQHQPPPQQQQQWGQQQQQPTPQQWQPQGGQQQQGGYQQVSPQQPQHGGYQQQQPQQQQQNQQQQQQQQQPQQWQQQQPPPQQWRQPNQQQPQQWQPSQ